VNRHFAANSALRYVVIVELQIVLRGRRQLSRIGEPGLLEKFADAAVEAFDHAIRLRVSGRRQTVLNGDAGTGNIEGVVARRLLVFGGKSVGKL
jgi:hypothetical protein